MEKYSQNDSLNEVISYDDKRFIVVKNDKSVHILTEIEVRNLGKDFILSVDKYSPQKYSEVLNEVTKY